MKQNLIEMKAEIEKPIIIIRDFNTPLSITDRIDRWKIRKDIANSNNINKIHLTDICRTFQTTRASSTRLSMCTCFHVSRWTIFWATKQVSVNLKGLKIHKV